MSDTIMLTTSTEIEAYENDLWNVVNEHLETLPASVILGTLETLKFKLLHDYHHPND